MSHFLRLAAFGIVAILAGCSSPAGAPVGSTPASRSSSGWSTLQTIKTPAVVAVDMQASNLVYWQISRKGGSRATVIAHIPGLNGTTSMAADGNTVVLAVANTRELVLYNTQNGWQTTLEDPSVPSDVAIDKNGTIYANNFSNSGVAVAMYVPGSPAPKMLKCGLLSQGVILTPDNEGDLIVAGYNTYTSGAIEFQNGAGGLQSGKCSVLPLRLAFDNLASILVDPKTDDLIVFHNPGQCAGGGEGQITVYPKPYEYKTEHSRNAGGVCPGPMRLAADSKSAFIVDASFKWGTNVVRQVSIPDGKFMASYRGVFPIAVTTVPNSLPN